MMIFLFYIFLFVFIAMIAGILLLLYSKSIKAKKIEAWETTTSLFIQGVIFLEIEDNIVIPADINLLLKSKFFRRYIAAELRKAKSSLTGEAAQNLIRVYKILKLDRDILWKLKSSKWHLKVQSIKELAAMEQHEHTKQIFRLTNHAEELLRMEAQCALVDLYGFPALRFLNVITHSLSEWQQILLLHKLSHNKPANDQNVFQWLHSKNNSVVIFAMKLVSYYKCYEHHGVIVNCLNHPSPEVRIEAIKCLREIFIEETTADLISHEQHGDKRYELLLLGSLQGYLPEMEAGFLVKQLGNQDDEIKFAAAEMLFDVTPGGKAILYNYHSAGITPWKQIITHLEKLNAA